MRAREDVVLLRRAILALISGGIDMKTTDLERHVKQVIVNRLGLDCAPEDIDSDKSLRDHYGLDSLDLLELSLAIEDEYGIVLEESSGLVEKLGTVNRIIHFIQAQGGYAQP